MPNISTNTYLVNWRKLVYWLMPFEVIYPKIMALLKALVEPVNVLHTDLLQYRKRTLYDLSITPQVCRLETMLNDAFDKKLRRIYIDDGTRQDQVYLFTEDEGITVGLYKNAENLPVYLYNNGELGNTAVNFIVYVPIGLKNATTEKTMAAMLNLKKLPSKTFKIQYF